MLTSIATPFVFNGIDSTRCVYYLIAELKAPKYLS